MYQTYISKVKTISALIKYTDEQLIEQTLGGKMHAFNELYNRYKNSLFVVSMRYARDRHQANDFFQEGMIALYKGLSKYDVKKGAFYTWAGRVMVNACLQTLRKKYVLKYVDSTESIIDYGDDPEVYSDLGIQELTELISSLPDGYRTVFNLYVIDGFSHKEIAEQLGISINTSKTQLHKARKLLQKKRLNEESVELIG